MRTTLLFLLLLPATFSVSFSYGEIASLALDYIPIVGNLKSIKEAYDGKDMITQKKLSTFGRALSLLGAIPGVNYFKNSKHLKNAQKFWKASKRAEKVGKLKNAEKFLKASKRAFAKAKNIPKIAKNTFKVVVGFFY